MNETHRKILKKILKIIIIGAILVGGFVGWNLWKDRNVVRVEQSAAPTFEEVRSEIEASIDDSAEEQSQETDSATETEQEPVAVPESEPAPQPVEEPAGEDLTASTLVERSGAFTGFNGYSAAGTVKVTQIDGQNLLVFDDDFVSSNGPDLLIYLSENNVEAGESLGEFISLGAMQSTSGGQVYVLPDNVEDFESVVIWCRAFSQLFGAADLDG